METGGSVAKIVRRSDNGKKNRLHAMQGFAKHHSTFQNFDSYAGISTAHCKASGSADSIQEAILRVLTGVQTNHRVEKQGRK